MAAPAAVNKQPWHFVAITDREKLDGIATANPNAGMAKKAPLVIGYPAEQPQPKDKWLPENVSYNEYK